MSQDQHDKRGSMPDSAVQVLQVLQDDRGSIWLAIDQRMSPSIALVVKEVLEDHFRQGLGRAAVMEASNAFALHLFRKHLDRSTGLPRWESQDDPAPIPDPESD